jgi:hypothetical protein
MNHAHAEVALEGTGRYCAPWAIYSKFVMARQRAIQVKIFSYLQNLARTNWMARCSGA